ncbi:MAG: preprotein translocase subunit SecG [Candidatus Omnitrophota bacterium]
MMTFIIILHALVCVLLVFIVLIQSGRGGGLVDSFSGVENMLGTKTNTMLTRTTTVLATLFIITCLSLAYLSLRQSKSLMANVKDSNPAAMEGNLTKNTTEEKSANQTSSLDTPEKQASLENATQAAR